jgi:CHAT domain-containing protein/tetratricopeptide (TPR) repeat protein
MSLARCIGKAWLVGALACASTSVTRVTAQPFDIQAAQQRFQSFYTAGDYTAALEEAKKTEAAAKRGGTNNITYVSALNDLARAHLQLGHYADSTRMFQQVFDTLRKNIPANDQRLIQAENNLADADLKLNRADEAERHYKHTLEVMTGLVGTDSPELIEIITRLGTVYMYMGQSHYDAAEAQFKRALDIADKSGRQDSAQEAVTLNNVFKIYEDEDRFAEAEDVLKRALKINEAVRGPNHPEVAFNVGNLAHLYERLGRYAESETLYRRAIGVWETLNPEHPELVVALQNLGTVYVDEGRFDEAEALLKRALNIREKVYGADSFPVATELNNLASLYEIQGRYADVETFANRAFAIVQKAQGPDDPDTAKVLRKLGVANDAEGHYAEADAQFKRALDIFNNAYGPDNRYLGTVLISQGHMFEHQHRPDAAEAAYLRALDITQRTRGVNHPEVARVLNDLALLNAASGDVAKALNFSRRATAAILAHAAADRPNAEQSSEAGGLIEKRAAYFANHVANLAAAARAALDLRPNLGREAFVIAQWASHSSAASAVQQMGARFASGSGPMVALARESQDLGAAWRDADRKLFDALAQPDSPANRTAVDAFRKRIAELDARLTEVGERLEKEFPEYAALISPKPIAVSDVQALLAPAEALVFWLPGEKETTVFAITKDNFDWQSIPFGADLLAQKVAAFRVGLDPNAFVRSVQEHNLQQFDLELAYELYSELLGPVESLIKDKYDLMVVAAGSLTALPMNVLVTAKPKTPKPDHMSDYRDAAWLIKRHAVSVLPSVASLKALRVFARKDDAGKPMVGFGDPVLDPNATPAGTSRGVVPAAASSQTTRSYTDFWRGASVDRGTLSQSLHSLPETRVELNTIAGMLSVPTVDIFLGKDASETTVKGALLSDYRIVYFATHALVAGDIKGLAEPSLVLSIPAVPSDLDDGLLTASEVAQLKLNADWVVLSACNTIAGDKPGAEALSGLARAFFYAGARALLVSHWPVETTAATRLTTGTFKVISDKVGRAEALRLAMLEFMQNPNESLNAYPAFWAPFEVVGEGSVR